MKKRILLLAVIAVLCCIFAVSVSAAAPAPSKPDIGVEFGSVSTIEGFVAPSELFVGTTQRVLLVNGDSYVTYPTYYVTKDSTTFDLDFSKLNAATGIEYGKESVIMLEVPTGVTAFSNNYFNKKALVNCVSVQIPGTVTNYGSKLFANNETIKVVEFLDGTEPVTMGDQMFGGGYVDNREAFPWNLAYVKFPNNLVSIGNNTFGKTTNSSKVIILGDNLKSIGTGFFSEATPKGKDTFLYVSDNFFKDTALFTKLFGGYDQYHNNHLRLTIFYTGTQAQAQALVDRGLAVQPKDYIWNNASFVSAANYDYATHKPTTDRSVLFVYDYSKCDAFYGGHSFAGKESVITSNLFEVIRIGDACTKCGAGQVTSTIAPLFTWKGYSVCTFGEDFSVTQGYFVNNDAVDALVAVVPDFDYGGLATVNTGTTAIKPMAGDEGVLSGTFDLKENEYIDIKVVGIPSTNLDTNIIFCVYVVVNGEVSYLDNDSTMSEITGVSYNSLLK